jgi:hypothetical protein
MIQSIKEAEYKKELEVIKCMCPEQLQNKAIWDKNVKSIDVLLSKVDDLCDKGLEIANKEEEVKKKKELRVSNDYKKIYPPNQRKMKNNHVFDEDSDENSDKDVDFKFEKVHKERSPENHMNVTKDSGDEYKEDTEVFTIYELKLLKDFYERLNKLTNSELNTMNKIFAKTFPAVSNDDMVRVRFTLGQRFQDWEIEKLHKLNLKEKVTWTKTIIQGSKTVFNLRYEDLSKVVQLKRLVGHSNFSKLNKESVIKWKNFVDKGLPNLTYEEVTILKSWFGKKFRTGQ